MTTIAELKAMKVNDLKSMCASRGLDTSGLKQDLVSRLFEALSSDAVEVAADGSNEQADKVASSKDAGPATEDQSDLDQQAIQDDDQNGKPVTGALPEQAQPKKRTAIVFDEAATQAATTEPATKASDGDAASTVAPTEEERRKQRAARFGAVKEADKIKQRAERFGLPHKEIEKEKLMKRAERFDIPIPEREEEKKRKRAERFKSETEDDKLQKRAQRFAADATGMKSVAVDAAEEEKRAARAKRFAAAS